MNESQTTTPMLGRRAYDVLKFIAQYVLPGLATLILTLGEIWGLSSATEIAASITAVDFFLGTVLGISHRQYQNSDERFDGKVDVFQTEQDSMGVRMNVDPDDFLHKKEVVLKVNNELQI